MAGYQSVLNLRRLEAEVDALGFMMCHPKHNSWTTDLDLVAIKPKDNTSLPIYTRDAEMFQGTLEQLRTWMQSVKWAREYDSMLKVSDDKKRSKKEDEERARQFSQQQKQLLDQLKKDHTTVKND